MGAAVRAAPTDADLASLLLVQTRDSKCPSLETASVATSELPDLSLESIGRGLAILRLSPGALLRLDGRTLTLICLSRPRISGGLLRRARSSTETQVAIEIVVSGQLIDVHLPQAVVEYGGTLEVVLDAERLVYFELPFTR